MSGAPARGERIAAFCAAAAVCGAAVTVVEFAALRRLAPWFGQSIFTWASDVGIVLLALALGSVLGGMLADRARTTIPFYRSLQWGAFWLAMAAVSGSALVPTALSPRLEEASGALPIGFWGSLAASAILFGPPMVALGMVSPFFVRRATRPGAAGRAAGWITAASTAGSLAGCYLAPFWLLPVLGTTTTLLSGAGAVAVVCLWGYLRDRRMLEPTAAEVAVAPDPLDGAIADSRASRLGIAFLAGFVVMGVEFAAVRLFAPWFGQSNPVWANAVGVVLLALAIGYALGGRIADRARVGSAYALLRDATLGVVLLAAVGPQLAGMLAPSDLSLERALPMSFWGSLFATVLLVAPPTALLGALTPVLVRGDSVPGRRGRAAGGVFAAGTLGSLAGTFLAPLALIGAVGSRRTLLVCAGLLGLASLAGSLRSRASSRRPVVASAGALVLVAVAWVFLEPTLRRDEGQLVEVESAYQTVRVAEAVVEQPFRARTRFLRFDEDVVSYQSVLLLDAPEGALTGQRYYEHLALGAWFEGMPWSTDAGAPRVLIVGYAGGTLHRVLEAVAPPGREPTVLGVEIDPAVPALAREHLRLSELEGPRLTLLADEDGRAVLEALPSDADYDLILVDAYQRTQYVPFHLATVEFFRACRARLGARGAIGMNVMTEDGLAGALVRAIGATLRETMGRDGAVYLVPNPYYPGSVTFWATTAGPPRVSSRVPASLSEAAFALELLLVRHTARDGGLVLTDDRAPTEALADESLVPARTQ